MQMRRMRRTSISIATAELGGRFRTGWTDRRREKKSGGYGVDANQLNWQGQELLGSWPNRKSLGSLGLWTPLNSEFKAFRRDDCEIDTEHDGLSINTEPVGSTVIMSRQVQRGIPMRRLLALGLLAIAVTIVPNRVQADDNVKAVIEKAIKAHGGEANLTKYQAAKFDIKGKLSIMGTEISFTGTSSYMLPDKFREEIKVDVMGQEFTITQGSDGKNAWSLANGAARELKDQEIEHLKDQAFENYVDSIVPLLKDKDITLRLVGDEMVNEKPAIAILVKAKGHKDRTLSFDKESGLLVKSASKMLKPDMEGVEVDGETFFTDFKDVDGVKVAMKQRVKQEGKDFLEAELSNYKLLEKIDSDKFSKPSD
jgi:hypothetical protein